MITISPSISYASCMDKYSNVIKYEISNEHINKDIYKLVRFDWKGSNYWGLKERGKIINGKNGDHIIRISFPKNSLNPSNRSAPRGGVGFNIANNTKEKITSACLQYKIFFPEDFEFVKGGKLPGLFGGKEAPSGCKKDIEKQGFSTRYMWRKDGLGTMYAYIPGKPVKCGQLLGYGNWKFPKGEWVKLEQEIILNDIGNNNGIIRYWVNDKLILNRKKSILRIKEDIYIEGMMFSSFFGGNDKSWASPKDQYLDFKNFKIAF